MRWQKTKNNLLLTGWALRSLKRRTQNYNMKHGKNLHLKPEGGRPGLLIHYGSTKYNPKKFTRIQNENWVKPKGGLWTSPINSEWAWKHWCESEQFRECDEQNSFVVELNDNANILVIDSLNDLKKIPMIRWFKDYPDFETIAGQYDAIWLTAKGQNETHLSHPLSLYGWDCESVLILHPDCITERVGVLNANFSHQASI